MTAVTVVPANIRPLNGPDFTRPFTAGGAGSLGDPVYIASDGDVEVADADAAGSAQAVGIVVSAPNGATTFVAGNKVDVAGAGAIVTGYSGLTPGALYYASTTAGAIEDTAPAGASADFLWIIMRALSATTVRVECWSPDLAAQ
jgi:hypothetical protein